MLPTTHLYQRFCQHVHPALCTAAHSASSPPEKEVVACVNWIHTYHISGEQEDVTIAILTTQIYLLGRGHVVFKVDQQQPHRILRTFQGRKVCNNLCQETMRATSESHMPASHPVRVRVPFQWRHLMRYAERGWRNVRARGVGKRLVLFSGLSFYFFPPWGEKKKRISSTLSKDNIGELEKKTKRQISISAHRWFWSARRAADAATDTVPKAGCQESCFYCRHLGLISRTSYTHEEKGQGVTIMKSTYWVCLWGAPGRGGGD